MYSIEWLTRKRAELEAENRAAGRGRFSIYDNPNHPRPSPVGERFSRDGAVLITPQQHALLGTIRAREDRAFPSIRAWVDVAAHRHSTLRRAGLFHCVRRLPEVWVARTRCGRRKLCTLQARGLAIVDGEIPVWLLGTGRIDRAARSGEVDRAWGGHASPSPARPSEPGVGQLLDRIEALADALETAPPAQAAALRARLVDAEVALSASRARADRPRDPGREVQAVFACMDASLHRRLDVFLAAAADVGPSIGDASRQALSFPYWHQRVLALEEVLLGGEARALGFGTAVDRRRGLREGVVDALLHRVVAIASSRPPGTP